MVRARIRVRARGKARFRPEVIARGRSRVKGGICWLKIKVGLQIQLEMRLRQ